MIYFIYYSPALLEFSIVSVEDDRNSIDTTWTFDSIAPSRFHSIVDMHGDDTVEEAIAHAQEFNELWCDGKARIRVLCE